MLTVPEQLMHSTVRIECARTDGLRSTGTGFFFKFLDDGKTHVPVTVTNKHVIRAALEAVGIRPYAPIGEATLRDKLGRLGLREVEIDSYFAEARNWMTHVTTVWPPQH